MSLRLRRGAGGYSLQYCACVALDSANPFASPSSLPYALPDFSSIRDEHYLPALKAGMASQLAEVEDIATNVSTPTFENTVEALERSGQLLGRVARAFFNKTYSDSNPTTQAIEEEIAPALAQHHDSIHLNSALFARIQELYGKKDQLGLDEESAWLLEKYYEDFVHAGAALCADKQKRLRELNTEISLLSAKFNAALLAETNDLAVIVDSPEELAGLTPAEITRSADAAKEQGHDGKYLLSAVNFSGHPLLAVLSNRATREKLMKNSLVKGIRSNDNDTRALIVRMAVLRAERAALFGKANHAEHVISKQTAKSPANVHAMLRKIAGPAVANAKKEAAEIQHAIREDGKDFDLQSWDWDYYSENIRRAKFSIDTASLKPYFELNRVLQDGVFFAANRLFGLTFTQRTDLIAYHPEARVFEVTDENNEKVGLYIADFYARASKRGGAWMNSLVEQNFLHDELPVVVNNLNVPKPAQGEPTLLTLDMTTTLFHEFGHALHGLLSKVRYPRFSGTAVQRDFVEFPSQVNEMWMLWPEVLDNYAFHVESGQPLPRDIVGALEAAENFNQGYKTTAYLAASILDLAWHQLSPGQSVSVEDVEKFERDAIADYGLDFAPVPTRYRSTYFSHIWSSDYSAGYYGYIWSEVLDADTVEWFKDNGGLTRANGEHFRQTLLGRGGSVDSMSMFSNFRGREASIEPLLRRRGLQ